MIKPIKAIISNDNLGQEFFKQALILIALTLHLPHISVAIFISIIALLGLLFPFFRKSLFKYNGSLIAFTFLIVTALVALVNRNFVGFLASGAFVAMLFVSAAARSIMTRTLFEKMLNCMVIGGCFSAVHSVIEFIVNHNVPNYRSKAFFNNPNFFGTALTFCVFICAFKAASNAKRVWLYYSATVILALGIYVSGSMSLWLVAVIGVFLTLVFLKNYQLLAIFCSIAVICIAMILIFPSIIHRLNELSATIRNRFQIWDFAVEQFRNSPVFGRGFYTYRFLYNQLHETRDIYPAAMAHSVILDGFLCHGIVGMSIITTAVVRFYTSLFETRKQLKIEGKDRSISGFMLAVGIAVSLYGLIDTTFVWVQTGMMLMFFTTGLSVEDSAFEN